MSFILIRNYKPADDVAVRELIYEGVMSTVNASFFNGLTREIFFQLIVIISALMFVFLGLPPSICLFSLPTTVLFMYICVFIGHQARAYDGTLSDINNITKSYMSSDYTGFWVAEAYEPRFTIKNPKQIRHRIIREHELESAMSVAMSYTQRIVGTAAITRSKNDPLSAWLRRMVVTKQYGRKGIATALIDEITQFCLEKGYENIDLITSECHDAARELYFRKGYEMKQFYHKPIIGNIVRVLMYELTYKLQRTESADSENRKELLNNSFYTDKM